MTSRGTATGKTLKNCIFFKIGSLRFNGVITNAHILFIESGNQFYVLTFLIYCVCIHDMCLCFVPVA